LDSGEDGERVVLSCGVTLESTEICFLCREPGMAKVRRKRGMELAVYGVRRGCRDVYSHVG